MTRLLPGTPIAVGDVTLLVIARLVIEADSSDHACWLYANKTPYALVIRDAQGLRALDMLGRRCHWPSSPTTYQTSGGSTCRLQAMIPPVFVVSSPAGMRRKRRKVGPCKAG